MSKRQQDLVALLRGINVGGRNKIPMAELRSVFADSGCDDVRTYIQSGNVIFTSSTPAAEVERQVEKAIERVFGFSVPVIVRPGPRWGSYVRDMPFPDEATQESNRVLLAVSKLPPGTSAAAELQNRATRGEQVTRRGDAIWIHYPEGVGQSKLTPAVLDRHIGSPATARNWRTVLKIHEMLRQGIDE